MARFLVAASATVAALLSACGNMGERSSASQAGVPDAVRVPDGNKVAWETVGVGELTYECREKQQGAGHEWVFVGPQAVLNDRSGRTVGKYYGPPATWESSDGSRVTGTQMATSPAAAGIPLQLVKANPAVGKGAMSDVTYIQRLATKGGAAPSLPCDAGNNARKEVVKYQADYLFWSKR